MSEQTADERRRPADPVDEVADDEDERVHPEHVRADDREHGLARVVMVVDDDRAGEGHHSDHDAEARLGGEDRGDDARPARGARAAARAACGSAAGVPTARSSAMRFGSGRTKRTSTSPTTMKPEPASQSSASESPSRSRPERSGLKTAGPRIAPKTAPKRTSAMPASATLGRIHVPGRGAGEQRRPAGHAHERRGRGRRETPTRARSRALPGQPPAIPMTNPVAITGTRPKRSIARPAGSAASAPEASTIAGPSPSSPLDAGDEHERQRGDRRRELEHA